MFESFTISDTVFTPYVFTNWFFCLISAWWLSILFWRKRFLFVKPSMVLLFCTHVFFQWPAAFLAGYYENFLDNAWIVPILIHTYVLVGLFFSSLSFQGVAHRIWERIVHSNTEQYSMGLVGISTAMASVVVIVGLYLNYIPFSRTGLHALFFQPQMADIARDFSFGALPLGMKYIFSFFQEAFAPLLLAFFVLSSAENFKKRKCLQLLLHLVLISGTLTAVSLTGARYFAVKSLLAGFLVLLFKKGLPFRPLRYFVILSVIFLPAALFTLLRESRETSLLNVFNYLFVSIFFERVLCTAYHVGMWHLQYAELSGFFGPGAIQKLAPLFGLDPIPASLVIGDHFLPNPNYRTNSQVGYLMSYYSYFGMISLPLSILLTFVLDIALAVYKRLDNELLLPAVTTVSIITVDFVQSDYTTVWITHGFGMLLVVCFFIQCVWKQRFFRAIPCPEEHASLVVIC